LTYLYLFTGIFSFLSVPLIGKLSDKIDKYVLFCIGTGISIVMVAIYTHLGITPLQWLVVVNIIMFSGIMSRMVPAMALSSAIPSPQDRGAYMAINSSVQQFSGGVAAAIAGMIIVENPDKSLRHFDWVGYVTIFCMIAGAVIMYYVNRMVQRKLGVKPASKPIGEALAT
jgi:predicted MFS family arabinose efflux permease